MHTALSVGTHHQQPCIPGSFRNHVTSRHQGQCLSRTGHVNNQHYRDMLWCEPGLTSIAQLVFLLAPDTQRPTDRHTDATHRPGWQSTIDRLAIAVWSERVGLRLPLCDVIYFLLSKSIIHAPARWYNHLLLIGCVSGGQGISWNSTGAVSSSHSRSILVTSLPTRATSYQRQTWFYTIGYYSGLCNSFSC